MGLKKYSRSNFRGGGVRLLRHEEQTTWSQTFSMTSGLCSFVTNWCYRCNKQQGTKPIKTSSLNQKADLPLMNHHVAIALTPVLYVNRLLLIRNWLPREVYTTDPLLSHNGSQTSRSGVGRCGGWAQGAKINCVMSSFCFSIKCSIFCVKL